MENNNLKYEINPITAGLILFQVVFTIVMVVAFSNVLGYEPVELGKSLGDVVGEIEGLSDADKSEINYHLYKAISKSGVEEDVGRTDSVIREGSLVNTYFEEADAHYVNFIVNLPELKQSYQVYRVWSDDVMNPYVSPNDSTGVICLKSDQLIYGEFNCEDTYSNMRNLLIGRFLYAKNYLLGNDGLTVNVNGSFQTGKMKFVVHYMDCDSQCLCRAVSAAEQETALDRFGEFVRGLCFRLQDIDYQFDNC